MWQYTTETIINSNKGKLTLTDNLGAIVADDSANKINVENVRFYVKDNTLYIEGVGVFKKDSVKNAWYRPYQAAIPASGDLAVPAATAGHVYRLQVWVSEEGTIRPELQNAMLVKSIPFHFEVEAVNGEALEVTLAKAIKKTFAKKGAEKLFTATASSKKLTLTATDCYVRIDQVRLDEVPNTTAGYVDLTGYQNYTPVQGATWTKTAHGTEGNGTVARLVKNLRLPTKASLDPFGADQGGKPVPGGQYDQFMFEYVTDRSHVGHQVLGSVGDKSLTTHVFFVEESVSSLFKGCLDVVADNVEEYQPTADVATGNNKQAKVAQTEGLGAKK